MKINSKYRQQGAETLEFALVAVFYFALLFGVFEFARALYTWNVLTEATRRGARLAAVCPYNSPIPLNVAVFDDFAGTLGTSPVVKGLTAAKVTARYLNDLGAVVDIAGGELESEIKFVEVTITHQHQMLFTGLFSLFVPDWTGTLNSPTFQTTLPAESLGADPTFSPPAEPVTCNF